jgi:hypothetical protein
VRAGEAKAWLTRRSHLSAPRIGVGPRGGKGLVGRIPGCGPTAGFILFPFSFYFSFFYFLFSIFQSNLSSNFKIKFFGKFSSD